MGLLNRLLGSRRSEGEADLAAKLGCVVAEFMGASLSMVEFKGADDTAHRQAVVYGYAFGALDAISQKNDADDLVTLGAAAVLFTKQFEMSSDETGRVVKLCMRLSADSFYSTYVIEGGQAMLDWASGRDPVAPIRLAELLSDHQPPKPQ